MSRVEQPKERWFSNHRPSNRGGAAKSAVTPGGFSGGAISRDVWRLRGVVLGSVVGKPPLLGLQISGDSWRILGRSDQPRCLAAAPRCVGSVVGKPPLLGLLAARNRNFEPRHPPRANQYRPGSVKISGRSLLCPFSARSAAISPITLQNLNPWPEPPKASTTLGRLGSWSTMKSKFLVVS